MLALTSTGRCRSPQTAPTSWTGLGRVAQRRLRYISQHLHHHRDTLTSITSSIIIHRPARVPGYPLEARSRYSIFHDLHAKAGVNGEQGTIWAICTLLPAMSRNFSERDGLPSPKIPSSLPGPTENVGIAVACLACRLSFSINHHQHHFLAARLVIPLDCASPSIAFHRQ
jgi:hypothetical protein